MVVGLDFDPILRVFSQMSPNNASADSYRSILRDMSHEERREFEERERDHLEVLGGA